DPDRAKMFGAAHRVFKDGTLVVRGGNVVRTPWGRALAVRPEHDRAIARRMNDYSEQRYGISADFLSVPEGALPRPDPFEAVSCARGPATACASTTPSRKPFPCARRRS